MRTRGQRGASLIIVLAITAFLAVLLPAILSLEFTGARVTGTVIEDRRELYAASSAIDATIQVGREDGLVGRRGDPCPVQTLTVNGTEVTVKCLTPEWPVRPTICANRSVTYIAHVAASGDDDAVGDEGGPPPVAAAQVQYRLGNDRRWVVDVDRWTTDEGGIPGRPPLPDGCVVLGGGPIDDEDEDEDGPPPELAPGLYTDLSNNQSAVREPGVSRWRAELTIDVTNHLGEPVVGAPVEVQVQYLSDGIWEPEPPELLSNNTDETGRLSFRSATRQRTGKDAATKIRITVSEVLAPDAEADPENALVWTMLPQASVEFSPPP